VRGYLLDEIKGLAPQHGSREKALTMRQRAANSLILRHLRASGCAYSVSIFSTESGLGDSALDAHEICDALQLPRETLDSRPTLSSPSAAARGGAAQEAGDTELLLLLTAAGRLILTGDQGSTTQTAAVSLRPRRQTYHTGLGRDSRSRGSAYKTPQRCCEAAYLRCCYT